MAGGGAARSNRVRDGARGPRGRRGRSAARRPDAARPRPPQGDRPRPRPWPPHAHADPRADAPPRGAAGAPDGAANGAGAQRGKGSVMPRLLPTILLLTAVLVVGVFEVAWGQTAPIQGLEKLTPEERAIAERNLERWQRSEEHTSELQSQSNIVCRLL